MIGRSLPEYVFIRLSIITLRLVPFLSVLYLTFSWHHGYLLYPKWLALYAVVEAGFYLLVSIARNWSLQKAAKHPPLSSREEREALFARCFDQASDSRAATGWFLTTAPEFIKRENMVEWLLWALFGTESRSGLKDEWAEEIEGYLAKIENLLGRKLDNGWNNSVTCMKVTLDPVVTIHRPLVWYLIVASVDTLAGLQLMNSGFRHYTSGNWTSIFPPRTFTALSHQSHYPDLIYWLRPHRSTTKDPILFLHGIGIGLWPYVPFLRDVIDADPDVGIIAVEILAISMHISPPILTRPATLAMLLSLLDTHNLSRVIVAAHSYGTVVAAHMLRDPVLSQRVSGWLLIDPIPFLLHLPAVAYNFVYRPPRTANEWQMWYFASRDPDVARTLARHFFWSENILWKEDIEGKHVAVVLSGQDQIVDAKEVRAYLTGEDNGDRTSKLRWKKDRLEVLYYPDLDHAQVFDTKNRRRLLVELVHDLVQVTCS